MRTRFLLATISACALLGLLPGPVVASHRAGPCALHRGTDEPVRHYSKRLIRCATEEWPVRGGHARAVCIAARESNLIPTAESETGQYLGLFQHAALYWPHRYQTWTRAEWELSDRALNARTNTIVTIRMVNTLGGWKVAGWPVLDC